MTSHRDQLEKIAIPIGSELIAHVRDLFTKYVPEGTEHQLFIDINLTVAVSFLANIMYALQENFGATFDLNNILEIIRAALGKGDQTTETQH